VRRVWLLIEHLPPDSAYATASNPERAAWPLTDHLLAAIFDSLQLANWQRAGNNNAPKPPRVPRPGVRDEEAQRLSFTEVRAKEFLERQAQRRKAAQ
jgi:hypothetical protein